MRLKKTFLLTCMLLVSFLAGAQGTQRVSGRIVDVDGEVMIGVSILEKGTTSGTITDIDGNYTLKLTTKKPVLQVSYVGFEPKEVSVESNIVDIVLHQDVQLLDEVEVVGYGSMRKISVLGAQSTLKMEDVKIPVANMSSVLTGRVSGLVAVQRSGVPGKDDSDIWIRGISSMTNVNEGPLVLVDGIERDFNQLDPEDIESVTVLKDAASTAVYGVRGGNGVILITTKPGEVSAPRISLDYYEGITSLTKVPDLVDGYDYMDAVNEAYKNTYGKAYYSDQYIENTKIANGLLPNITNDRTINKYLYPNVNWMDELYKKQGFNRRANLNIRGGAPNASYYISLSYYDEAGLTKTDPTQSYSTEINYSRYNFLTNVNLKPTKKTKLDVGVSGYFSNGNYPALSLDEIYKNTMRTNPVLYPVQYPNGENPGYSNVLIEMDSPYVNLTRRGYKTEYTTQINSNLKLTQDLDFFEWSKGFSAHALIAFDVTADQNLNYAVHDSTWKPTGNKDSNGVWIDNSLLYDEDGNLVLSEQYKGNSSVSFNSDKFVYRTFYFETALNYNRRFEGGHNVSGLALFNLSEYRNANVGSVLESLPYKDMSFSSRLTYSYDDRYFVEGNMGYTGSENFSPGERFGLFPAGAIGWVPSSEHFWDDMNKYISFLKVRYSIGLVGSDSMGSTRFGYSTEIKEDGGHSYNTSWGNSNSLLISQYGYKAQWSTILKQDIGLEVKFLNNELSFVADLFKEYRDNIYVPRNDLPLYAGFATTASANVGIVENKGLEMSLEYNHQFGKDWFVSVRGNYSMNKDKVIENSEAPAAYPWLETTGTNVLARFGYVAEGLYESDAEIKERGISQFGETYPGELVKPGDIMYKDLNGDNHIDEYDMCQIGRGDVPMHYYGFGGDIRYKNIGLGFLFQGNAGSDRMLSGSGVYPFESSTGGGTLYANITDRWSADEPSNDNVFYPRLAWSSSDPSNENNFVNSSWWLYDMSFLRLKNITVSYYFPESWKKGFIKGGRFYLMGSNVLTFSDFDLWDPELNTNNGTSYPNVTTFTIGATVNL